MWEDKFNPLYEAAGIKIRLTAICHDAGCRAMVTGYKKESGEAAYYAAYFDALKKFMPDHPALKAHDEHAV